MAVTPISGARTTDIVSSSLIKRDVYEAIFNFKPYQTPLTQFFMANKTAKYATGNPKFELHEDVLFPHSDTFNAITGGGTTETLTATSDTFWKVGDIIRVPETGENLRVTLVSSTSVTVAKVGAGNITAAAAGTFYRVGSAFAEGGTSATALSTTSTFPYNYTQIHKQAVQFSGTQMATVNYGGSDFVNQRVKATEEFKLELERSWIYGIRHIVTTAQAYIRTSSGLLDTAGMGISDVSQYTGTVAPSEDYFFKTFCKNLFAKGTNRKKFYVGADLLLAINDFSKVKQQTKVSEKEYGVDVQTILTPFGMLDLVWHPLLEGSYSTWGIAVDRDNFMKYVYLNGNGVNRDIQYQQNIGLATTDGRLDQYLAEVGLHLAGGGQGVHRILYPGA